MISADICNNVRHLTLIMFLHYLTKIIHSCIHYILYYTRRRQYKNRYIQYTRINEYAWYV